jgi:hypothetical protein
MSQTPYSPPAARVSDVPRLQQPKPPPVRRAVSCLWISVLITLMGTAWQLAGLEASADIVSAATTGVVTAGIVALVAAKIGAGRGWARWLFGVLYVVGLLLWAVSLVVSPEAFLALSPLEQASMVVQFALQTCAVVLLFTRASREWFKSQGG